MVEPHVLQAKASAMCSAAALVDSRMPIAEAANLSLDDFDVKMPHGVTVAKRRKARGDAHGGIARRGRVARGGGGERGWRARFPLHRSGQESAHCEHRGGWEEVPRRVVDPASGHFVAPLAKGGRRNRVSVGCADHHGIKHEHPLGVQLEGVDGPAIAARQVAGCLGHGCGDGERPLELLVQGARSQRSVRASVGGRGMHAP